MFTDRKRQINGPQGRRKEFFQALQLLFPNSASGIARTLPPFLLYIFKFPDSRCRPLVSLSDNLNPFQRYRGGKHKLCMWGGNGQIQVGWHPVIRKDHRFIGIHYFLARARKKLTQYSLLQQIPRETLIGDIAMVIVKFCPRWPHIYALHPLSHPTMTAGRLRKMYTRSRRRVDEQAVAKYGVIL